MVNLLERSVALHESILVLEQLDAEGTRRERLNTRADQIAVAANALDKAYISAAILEAQNAAPTTLPKPSSALRSKAPQLRTELTADWRTFAERSDIDTTFVSRVLNHADILETTLLGAWQTHVNAGLPDIPDDFLAAFANAGFSEECTALREFRNRIEHLRRTLPDSAAYFAELDTLKMAIQKVWGELEGVPSNVIDFLKKAASRQAAFADLTPAIQAWLDARGMLGKLRIGLG